MNLEKLARLIRYYILVSTTQAGSGHPTSSLSATDLMTTLFFDGHFHFDFDHPDYPGNDRLIFSKGHASPLFYALYLAAGVVTPEEIMTLRQFDSRLEGHPTSRFPYTEAATGSLGQGLSVGVGMALAINKLKTDDRKSRIPRVYVLLGDGEMAEGSVWEAINLASYYRLSHLVAIVDVNRLGQSQETMVGWNTDTYKKRFEAFGWKTIVVDGHDFREISKAFQSITSFQQPFAIIAKTVKGKGISFLEDKDGWHGKPVPKEQLSDALQELGEVDLQIRGKVRKPQLVLKSPKLLKSLKLPQLDYQRGQEVATRKAYGSALVRLGNVYPEIVALDAEVKNSTYAEMFKEKFPDRFFEMFIAEQNMVSSAVGFAKLGFIPFVSSFACFLTRGFDQMRMAALTGANIKFCGSHCGVSIGEDGPSQMGLEDMSMFRSLFSSVVLYPADAVATEKLVFEMVKHRGICYLRTSRPPTPVIYNVGEKFPIGGSKIHTIPTSLTLPKKRKEVIIIAAGVTLFESLQAQEELAKKGIVATVVDCYCVKPIDEGGLRKLVSTLKQKSHTPIQIVTVEDHWYEGGLGDAVLNVFGTDSSVSIHKLTVGKLPRSGKPAELMEYEEISAAAIVKRVTSLF